jgi:hypothetical protein
MSTLMPIYELESNKKAILFQEWLRLKMILRDVKESLIFSQI